MERKQMTFFRSFWEAIKSLPEEERLACYDAILTYAFDGTEPKLTGAALAIFIMAKPVLDVSKRRGESGSIGGKNGTGESKARSNPQANRKQTASKMQAIPSLGEGVGEGVGVGEGIGNILSIGGGCLEETLDKDYRTTMPPKERGVF